MTPTRVSARGSFRLDRVAPAPVGRIALATGAATVKEFRRCEALYEELVADHQFEVLAALKRKEITFAQLLDAKRQGQHTGSSVLVSVKTKANLWTAINTHIPEPERGTTEHRYWMSLKKFAKLAPSLVDPRGRAVIGTSATVADLARLDWKQLRDHWMATPIGPVEEGMAPRLPSPSDWMHLRRAISVFLTRVTGDVMSGFRRSVVKSIPTLRETKRVPTMSLGQFWDAVYAAPERARGVYVTFAATGLRLGEFLRIRPEHLDESAHALRIWQTKPEPHWEVIYVDRGLWHWVEAAVPSPIQEKRLRATWKDACEAADVPYCRLHDLRHLFAQTASAGGNSTAEIQSALRQSDPAMTRRYEMQANMGKVSRTVGRQLLKVHSRRKAG